MNEEPADARCSWMEGGRSSDPRALTERRPSEKETDCVSEASSTGASRLPVSARQHAFMSYKRLLHDGWNWLAPACSSYLNTAAACHVIALLTLYTCRGPLMRTPLLQQLCLMNPSLPAYATRDMCSPANPA